MKFYAFISNTFSLITPRVLVRIQVSKVKALDDSSLQW